MTDPLPSNETVRPALHHFGLTTAHLDPMVGWYSRVLGMTPTHLYRAPAGARTAPGVGAAWLGNDDAHHRVVIVEKRGLTDDPLRSCHKGFQHVAFAYRSLDDLLATFARLRDAEIKPVWAADHGVTTSLYYEDPDRNSVELIADNFGSPEESATFMRSSPEFAANPRGVYVDPEQLLAARRAGMPAAEVHRRAYAGEFSSAAGSHRHRRVTTARRGVAV
jgi:catechol 2,3-dioxygenase-like lactoylglutathione lyase family enzyme